MKEQSRELPLSMIKEIQSLEELVKYDDLFRSYSKGIVVDQSTADDIVNDMYLKVHKAFSRGKIINGGYICITLKNLFLNHTKQIKKLDRNYSVAEPVSKEIYDTDDLYPEESFESPDVDEFEDIYKSKIEDEVLYTELERRIGELTWYEQSILKFSQEMSLLELSRRSKISYRSLVYTKNKVDKKIGVLKKLKE